MKSFTSAALIALTALFTASPALAANPSLCVYDPGGAVGTVAKLAQEFASISKVQFGTDVDVRVSQDESVVVSDYKASKCDAVFATGVRLQEFNNFSSTIEAVGAVTDYDIAKRVLTGLATSATAAPLFRSGDHETAGLLPAGLVYLFLRDRSIDTVGELSGKKIAYMSYDPAAATMVNRVAGTPVASDLANFASRFNSGAVDACYMPALGYGVFDLKKGVGTAGGVVDLPLALGTFQLLTRHAKFPAEFGTKARAWFATKFDSAVTAIKKEEANIPSSSWIRIPAADRPGFDDMFLQVRLSLKGKAYHPEMLKFMRMARCGRDATRSECAEKKE
jgi:hypothetical protein